MSDDSPAIFPIVAVMITALMAALLLWIVFDGIRDGARNLREDCAAGAAGLGYAYSWRYTPAFTSLCLVSEDGTVYQVLKDWKE